MIVVSNEPQLVVPVGSPTGSKRRTGRDREIIAGGMKGAGNSFGIKLGMSAGRMGDRRVAICVAHDQSVREAVRLGVGFGKIAFSRLPSLLAGTSLEHSEAETGSFAWEATAAEVDLQFAQATMREGAGAEDSPTYDRTGKNGFRGCFRRFREHLRTPSFSPSSVLLFCWAP